MTNGRKLTGFMAAMNDVEDLEDVDLGILDADFILVSVAKFR